MSFIYYAVTEEKSSALFMSFNRELIERTQQYFLTKTGVSIDESTTIDYLNQLADLYESFEAFAQNYE